MNNREPLSPGSIVHVSNDEYAIEKLISYGGTSLIYEAYRDYNSSSSSDYTLDKELSRKKVIIKELAPYDISFKRNSEGLITFEYDDNEELKDIFYNEIYNIAYIQENNNELNGIPDMDAYGEYNGTVYIVMNHLKGVLLSDFIENKKYSNKELLDIFKSMLNLVRVLHTMENAVYHLDLKPSNFIVGNLNNVHLFDFGSVLISSKHWVRNYTECYSSPEVIYDDIDRIDEKSDIYSLGIIFLEMITKKTPVFEEVLLKTDTYYEVEENEVDFNPLLSKMLATRPRNRIDSIDKVLEYLKKL